MAPHRHPWTHLLKASSLSDYRAEMRKVVASLRRCETLRARRALCDASASAKKRQPWLVDDDGYIYTYIHTYIHIYIYTYIYTYIHTYIHIYIYTYVHIYICTYIHMYIYTYIHMYICTYTFYGIDILYIHIYIHIHIVADIYPWYPHYIPFL